MVKFIIIIILLTTLIYNTNQLQSQIEDLQESYNRMAVKLALYGTCTVKNNGKGENKQ